MKAQMKTAKILRKYYSRWLTVKKDNRTDNLLQGIATRADEPLHQHLPGRGDVVMDLPLNPRLDHLLREPPGRFERGHFSPFRVYVNTLF